MSKNKIMELKEFGQSIWLDYISRSLIETGKLKEMIENGLRGMTSNPTIFDKAISRSADYDEKIRELCSQGKSTFEIYDELTVGDIQDACDLFLSVYKESGGLDGYVSLEVNPQLALKTQETIDEAKRLHKKVNRPNVMFKVPSTKEGFPAVEELTAYGMNVNITLIFSLEQYVNTAQSYLDGVTRLLKSKGDAAKVRSVASVFVSRIDTACDKLLDELTAREERQDKEKLSSLKGKAAVANSALIYKKYLEIFSSAEFKRLNGANIQRVLWGSTSAKNPAYSDIKYVTELIGKGTVNTTPKNTIKAFLGHGAVKEALTTEAGEAGKLIKKLAESGININDVCAKLLEDGVAAFEKSFLSLLKSIEEKAAQLCKK